MTVSVVRRLDGWRIKNRIEEFAAKELAATAKEHCLWHLKL